MDHHTALFDLLGDLARRRYQLAERYFSKIGLNHTEARLLTLLSQEGGTATQDRLSGLLFVDRSNAGRALKRLERDRYVIRKKDDSDKRTNLVEIDARGRDAIGEISKLKSEIVKNFLGNLSDQNAATIVNMLEKATRDDNPEAGSKTWHRYGGC
ncbi:MarR family transcriptional regulator [bacterium]|nr:MarR family transcriptional regulator [bacterium]